MEKVRACGASQVILEVCLLAPTERYTFMEFKKKKKKKKKDETRREMKHYVPKLNHRGANQKAEKFPRR